MKTEKQHFSLCYLNEVKLIFHQVIVKFISKLELTANHKEIVSSYKAEKAC